MVLSSSRAVIVHSADAETELTGPMQHDELEALRTEGYVVPWSTVLGLRDQLASTWSLWKSTENPIYLERFVELEGRKS